MASSSPIVKESQKVFINFRGDELRNSFVANLNGALRRSCINVFIDSDMPAGDDLSRIFKEIETSTVALVIISSRYTESRWCMKELELIMECVKREDLWVIPIFYKMETRTVKELDGEFGVKLWDLWRKEGRDARILKWDATLQDVLCKSVMESQNSSDDFAFMNEIIKQVHIALDLAFTCPKKLTPQGRRGEDPKPKERSNRSSNSVKPGGQSLKYLEDKLDVECIDKETRVAGIFGMPGIGKTYLAEKLFSKLQGKINHCVYIKFEIGKSKEQGQEWIQKKLLENLPNQDSSCADDKSPSEFWTNRLALNKIGVVLDNVIDKEQVNIFVNREWIKKGSRIVITTRSKSLIEKFDSDFYEVPGLNEKDSLELFRAQICRDLDGSFMEMSKKIVDFSGGSPFALKAFGDELKGKEEDEWETRLGTLAKVSNVEVRKFLRGVYENDLNEKQRDAFLDIVCFFISHDEEYVTTLLDSYDHETGKGGTEVRVLTDKFLIQISNGRVEMQNLLFTMGKEVIDTTEEESWLFAASTNELEKGNDKTRGIVLDMSEMEERPLLNQAFVSMSNLRYLKVYSSNDRGNSETACKLNLPDGLEFREDNIVRYIYWLKFPGEEVPSNLRKITDLRLPYSSIIDFRLPYNNIGSDKLAPNLKWVDLSHSSQLRSLSGLHNAPNLLRLNLEGCTNLEELPKEMKDLKRLIFLNLRECTSLSSLPNIKMESLKVLILSRCLKLQEFQVISEMLETLHLDGTAISEVPSTITTLKRLTLLNLKDCKNLVTLPDGLGKLMSLQELKLSRCSSLCNFPAVKENMVNLRVLLLDGTSMKEMPQSINLPFLSFLQRLCLSRNDQIQTLQFNTSHLKWLELKHCKNLVSLQVPLNLQSLDAHGCTSLKTVSIAAQDLLPLQTENIHSTYIFTNCNKLDQDSKKAIVSYVHKKSQLVSDDRYNRDFVFNSLIGTCIPGCQVPMWFDHKAVGSILKLKLPRDWNGGRLNGVALCVVVSFNEYKDQTTSLQVKCCCEFSDKNLSFIVGGWSEQGNDEPHKIESDHVFVGYTTWFNNNKREEEEHETAGYVATEVSLRFEVTNGTNEVAECEVMKCGFSLVYESDKTESVSWDASLDTPPRSEDSEQDETTSYVASEHDPSGSNGLLNGNEVHMMLSNDLLSSHDKESYLLR